MDIGLLQEELVINLVENNILPVCVEQRINFVDTLYNRNILLNFFLSKNLATSTNAVFFENRTIVVDFSQPVTNEIAYSERKNLRVALSKSEVNSNNLDSKLKSLMSANAVRTCYVMNCNTEVLSQQSHKDEPYFSKSVDDAIPLYESIALLLVQRDEYKGCFLVAVDSVQPEDEFSKNVIRFLVEEQMGSFKSL